MFRYFTWDPVKFANPTEMMKNLTDKGRKLVAIVDPHIKRDVGYFLHNDAETNGYYVKTPEGKDYEGFTPKFRDSNSSFIWWNHKVN